MLFYHQDMKSGTLIPYPIDYWTLDLKKVKNNSNIDSIENITIKFIPCNTNSTLLLNFTPDINNTVYNNYYHSITHETKSRSQCENESDDEYNANPNIGIWKPTIDPQSDNQIFYMVIWLQSNDNIAGNYKIYIEWPSQNITNEPN